MPVAQPQVMPTTEPERVGGGENAHLFQGYVVFAPLERDDLTFIRTDVEINLAQKDMIQIIKKHEAFFRSVIHDVIQKAILPEGKADVDQFGLKIAIKDALNRSMPEESVETVTFENFNLG